MVQPGIFLKEIKTAALPVALAALFLFRVYLLLGELSAKSVATSSSPSSVVSRSPMPRQVKINGTTMALEKRGMEYSFQRKNNCWGKTGERRGKGDDANTLYLQP